MTVPTPVSLSNESKLNILEASDYVSVDTEGVTMLMGVSCAVSGFPQGFYVGFNHAAGNLTEAERERLFRILSTRKALIFHNAVHDLRVLKRNGFDYQGPFFDTMLMAHWINEEQVNYSLNNVSLRLGGKPKAMPPEMSMLIESDGWDIIPLAWMDEYSSNDAYITHHAFEKMLPEFNKQGFEGELWATEQEFIRLVMAPMMELGIKVDVEFCIKEYMRGTAIMQQDRKALGFNPGSPKALKKFLIDELELPIVKHTKSCKKCWPEDKKQMGVPVHTHDGPPSFDKDAMELYEQMLEKKDDPRATTILRYRGWQKTTSSNYKPYMELVDENFVLHPGYKLHGTKTGRLSCAEPNLQQIPKSSEKDWNGRLKSAFIARDGFGLWTVDYSQLQYRMTCSYAEQMDLIDIFNDPSRDIFTEMAKTMGWLRADVKTLVYLILFGGGARRASAAFGVTVAQGKDLVEEFHSLYPNIRKVSNEAQKAARRQGHVAYWTGRRRHFGPGSAYYRAFNAVIQGGEAEIIKRAMIQLAKTVCDDNCRMVLQIHDEIAFEIREGMEDQYLPRIQKVMEAAGEDFCKFTGVDVKFATSAGRWGEK